MRSVPVAAELARQANEAACRALAGSVWARRVLEQLLREAAEPMHERGWQAAGAAALTTPSLAVVNDQDSLVSLRSWAMRDGQTGLVAHLRAVLVASMGTDDFGWGRLYVEVVRIPEEVCGDTETVGRLASQVVVNVPALSVSPRPDEKPAELLHEHFDRAWDANQDHVRRQAFAFMAAQLDDALAP